MAETLLKVDAFEGWNAMRAERATWTYEEFRAAILSEFLATGIQASRDVAFYSTPYDPAILVAEVIQQLKREMLYCRHMCRDEVSLIRLF